MYDTDNPRVELDPPFTKWQMGYLDILEIHCPTGPKGAEICPKCYVAYPCNTAKICIGVLYG